MNKGLVVLALILGIILLIAAVVYFITPASALPSFMPGYDVTLTKTHLKHGIGSLFLSLALFAFAWFNSKKKSSPQIEGN